MEMADLISVYTTFPDRDTAARVTRALIEERLVACANLFPTRSTYRWRGAIEETDEWAALLKTRRALYPAVEERIRALHPYEVPAILGSPEDMVAPSYAAWVEESTRPA
jgi:periplasmic divalent cation tolerance protein